MCLEAVLVVLTLGVTDGCRPAFQHFSFRDRPLNLCFEHSFPPPSVINPLVTHMSVSLTDTRGGPEGGYDSRCPPCFHSDISKEPQTEIEKPSQKKTDQAFDLL